MVAPVPPFATGNVDTIDKLPAPPVVVTIPLLVRLERVAIFCEVFTVIVLLELVKPVEKVKADCFALKVEKSAALKAPLLLADAVGIFNVMVGLVVPFATDEAMSVPVVPNVNAFTLVTVPEEPSASATQSALTKVAAFNL